MMSTNAKSLTACLLTLSLLATGPIASATSIDPGFDLLRALPGTQWDFFDTPIPADFFGPGSDPFVDVVPFESVTIGPGSTDTIVERLDGIDPFELTTGDVTVPVEIVELNLVSSAPITVTFNGGMSPTPWFVMMDIEPASPSPGSMTVNHSDPIGGTFTTEFLIDPKFVFSEDLDFTTGAVDFIGAPIDFEGTEASWLHLGHPLDANTPSLPAGGFHAPLLDPIPWYGIHPINPASESQFLYTAAKIPEPSTLVLCCLGLVALIVHATLHRRRSA